MLRNYFKIAIRNLLANRLLSGINILGLAIGLACGMLILLYAKDELSFDRFHKNIDRIYQLACDRIEKEGTDEKFAIAAMVQGPAFARSIPEIESFVRVNPKQVTIKKGNESFIEGITWADDNFFSFFSFPLIAGDPKTALVNHHAVVLTEDAAKKYFGLADPIGKTLDIEINGQFEPFVISALAQNARENSSTQFNVVLPFGYLEETSPDNGWMWVSYPTYFGLKPHADLEAVKSKMEKVYRLHAAGEIQMNHDAGYDNRFVWSLIPFTQMHLNTEYKGSPLSSDPLYYKILIGIAIFILVIACINFINLTIAGSLRRNKEIGIRKAVGGLQKQLVFQFLCESFMVCFLSFLLAFLFTWSALPFFNALANKKISLTYQFDLSFVFIFLMLFLVTGFLSGFYPALVLSAVAPVQALYASSIAAGKNFLMKTLVVAQFSLASFFIIAVWMMWAQFGFLTTADLGYQEKNLVEFTVEKGIMNKPVMEIFKTEFSGVPGVVSAGFCNIGKFGGKTKANDKQFEAVYQRIDEGYVNTLQVHLAAGRTFSKMFPADSANSVLVNETFLQAAGWATALGKTIDYLNIPGWGDKKITVIGVVKDFHAESLKEKIRPLVFTMDSHLPMGKLVVRLKENNIQGTIRLMEKKYQSMVPDHPFQYAFREDQNRAAYDKESRWKSIISFGAGITIFISCIGLFGVSMLITKKRAKEIAIRKVLGASALQVLAMICSDFIKLVLLAFIIAAPFGWFAGNKWLEGFAYRIAVSWQMFTVTGIVSIVIALATISYFAAKASLSSPVNALRQP